MMSELLFLLYTFTFSRNEFSNRKKKTILSAMWHCNREIPGCSASWEGVPSLSWKEEREVYTEGGDFKVMDWRGNRSCGWPLCFVGYNLAWLSYLRENLYCVCTFGSLELCLLQVKRLHLDFFPSWKPRQEHKPWVQPARLPAHNIESGGRGANWIELICSQCGRWYQLSWLMAIVPSSRDGRIL